MNIKLFILVIALVGINSKMYGMQWDISYIGDTDSFKGISEKWPQEKTEHLKLCIVKVFRKGHLYSGFAINQHGDGLLEQLDDLNAQEYFHDFKSIYLRKLKKIN